MKTRQCHSEFIRDKSTYREQVRSNTDWLLK